MDVTLKIAKVNVIVIYSLNAQFKIQLCKFFP